MLVDPFWRCRVIAVFRKRGSLPGALPVRAVVVLVEGDVPDHGTFN